MTQKTLQSHNSEQIEKAVSDVKEWATRLLDSESPFLSFTVEVSKQNSGSNKLLKPTIRVRLT